MAKTYTGLTVRIIEFNDFIVTSGEETDVIDVQEWWRGAN